MRKTHICTPIFPPRNIVQTTTSNSSGGTIIGDFKSPPRFLGSGSCNLVIFDMYPRPFSDAIGWQPTCGAPKKMGIRPIRRTDGISCQRCLRSKAFKRHERRNK